MSSQKEARDAGAGGAEVQAERGVTSGTWQEQVEVQAWSGLRIAVSRARGRVQS